MEELTKITHVGAPIVLSIVAEEIRRSSDEPPAQATVVEVGLLLGEPGNSPPSFDNDKLVPKLKSIKIILTNNLHVNINSILMLKKIVMSLG